MKRRYCRGGVWHRPLAFLIWTILLTAIFLTPVISQTFDVVIIEKPRYLTAYNAFQQSLASSQLAMFQPFVPMKILNTRDVFSDGLTSCMKIDVDGHIYFLLNNIFKVSKHLWRINESPAFQEQRRRSRQFHGCEEEV